MDIDFINMKVYKKWFVVVFLLWKCYIDIRCESYVLLIIRLCVVVGIGMIDFLFFMGFWVLDIDIYYMLNIVVIVCWYFFKENVFEYN